MASPAITNSMFQNDAISVQQVRKRLLCFSCYRGENLRGGLRKPPVHSLAFYLVHLFLCARLTVAHTTQRMNTCACKSEPMHSCG